MARSYKTNIKKSTIDKLRERVSKRGYPFYLYQMRIIRLRGLEDTEISFDFPVTAIVGPNGSGKSTVLGATGLTSKRIKPRVFFARLRLPSSSGHPICADLVSVGEDVHCESTA